MIKELKKKIFNAKIIEEYKKKQSSFITTTKATF